MGEGSGEEHRKNGSQKRIIDECAYFPINCLTSFLVLTRQRWIQSS